MVIIDWQPVRTPKFERWTYSNKYSKTPHRNGNNDEFMLTSDFKPSYMEEVLAEGADIERKSDNLIPRYFLAECDGISLDEQTEIINKLDDEVQDYIKSITFSGSKSLHILFSIEVESSVTNREFKYLWKRFMKSIESPIGFSNNLDEACADKSRLSRNPNGIREDGTRQICLYYNQSPSVFNLNEWLYEFREEEEKRQAEIKPIERETTPDVSIEETLNRIYKSAPEVRRIRDMIKSSDFPSGHDYLRDAQIMTMFLSKLGYDDAEEWVRNNYLIPVSKVHPSNISPSRARVWTLNRN